MEKTIKLSDVIKICRSIQNDQLSMNEIEDTLKPIEAIPYLPIMEKYKNVLLILYSENDDIKDDSLNQMLYIEECKLWDILMSYTNIEMENESTLRTSKNYDLIMSTIGPLIIAMCESDYKVSCQMLDNAVQLSNIHKLLSMVNNVDISMLKDQNQEFIKAIEYLKDNSGTVDNLVQIAKMNNNI